MNAEIGSTIMAKERVMKKISIAFLLVFLSFLVSCAGRSTEVVTTVEKKYPEKPESYPIQLLWEKKPECPHLEIGTVRAWPIKNNVSMDEIISKMHRQAQKMGGDALVGLTEDERLVRVGEYRDERIDQGGEKTSRQREPIPVIAGRVDVLTGQRKVLSGTVIRYTDLQCIEYIELSENDLMARNTQITRLFFSEATDRSGNDYHGQIEEFRVRALIGRLVLQLNQSEILLVEPSISGQYKQRMTNPFHVVKTSSEADIIVDLTIDQFDYGKPFSSSGVGNATLKVSCQGKKLITGEDMFGFEVHSTSDEKHFKRAVLEDLLSRTSNAFLARLLKMER